MHEAQSGLCFDAAVAEGELNPILAAAGLGDPVAHLPGDGFHLAHIGARDPARELGEFLVHENGNHADLDALIEIFAAAGKTQPQAVIKMDVSHGGSPQIAVCGIVLLNCSNIPVGPEGVIGAQERNKTWPWCKNAGTVPWTAH